MRRTLSSVLVLFLCAAGPFGWVAFGPAAKAGAVQLSTLPTQVQIQPVGDPVNGGTGQLPVSIAVSPDGRTAVTADSGPSKSLTVLDITTREVVQRIDLQPAGDALYNGLVWQGPNRFYAAGGPSGQVYVYDRSADGSFARTTAFTAGRYIAALALNDGDLLAIDQDAGTLVALDPEGGTIKGTAVVGDHPEDVAFSADGTKGWVSNWGAKTISVVLHPAPGVYVPAGVEANRAGSFGDTRDYTIPGGVTAGTQIEVGDHPSDLLLSPDGKRLYVTNGNDDTVSVIDTATDRVVTTIDMAPYPNAPKSTAPQGLAISPDGATLYVANGGNNDVAVVDTATAKVQGLIPAGWYPSALALTDEELVIVNAKGDGPLVGYNADCNCYSGGADPRGSVYVLPLSDITTNLGAWTDDVMEYNRFDTRPGDISLPKDHPLGNVKKVIYVVRENKTFDQEFSDIEGADADPELLRYGREITPNSHAMAERWTLLDNFHVNTETSIIGHQFSSAGQLSDYTQRTFGNTLLWTGSNQGRIPDEGIQEISYPNSGYLVDNARRHGKSARVYGLEGGRVSVSKDAVDKDVNTVDLAFPPGFDNGEYPDTLRVREFLRDVKVKGLADFTYIWLPADHTSAAWPAMYGPREMVASNDVATGMVLDWLSHSKYWRDSAMFVVEDDPQSGKDHVSPYRSIFMAASPWLKTGHKSSEAYTIPGLLRTMELALGLPAMSQNEHSATPLLELFTQDADFSTYTTIPADVPPAFNPPVGAFATRSLDLNLSMVDQDEAEITELLEDMLVRNPIKTIPIDDRFGKTTAEKWRSVMNHDGPMTDFIPAAAVPSASMQKRIARATLQHKTEPVAPEDELAELHEWLAETRAERYELAASRGALGGGVGLLLLGTVWIFGRRARRKLV
ncbi:MAG: bifunctional YncE family protein/alkaline phosphatase family protein [Actinomycetota bacterium]